MLFWLTSYCVHLNFDVCFVLCDIVLSSYRLIAIVKFCLNSIMAEGIKCPQMQWGSGDDQVALNDFMTRLERWFTIRGIEPEKQHNFIIFQAGDIGEELCKTWGLSDQELKIPQNVWDKFQRSVGVANNFRVHRLNLTYHTNRKRERLLMSFIRGVDL